MRALLAALALAVFACASATASGPRLEATDGSNGASAGETTQSSSRTTPVGPGIARLPDFRLTTIDGERFALSDHVGKDVIVISFWATWCVPCLAELPHLSSLYQREKDKGLVVVAVSMDEPSTQAEVAPTARRLGLVMPVVIDDEQRAVRLYNKARNAPMTVVIDRAGRIVRAQAGYTPGDEEKLEAEVLDLLARS